MADYITVSQLNRLAGQVLAQSEPLNALILCGELSGFVRHYKSGHCYFTLKDENAAVKGVMFRDKARLLGFQPQDGMQVLAYGRAALYERDGSFQVYVEYMRPFGAGAAQMAFDALRKKLEAEGLLAAARKRPLPPAPRCIGVVTSKTGAALQDVCNVIGRRWPLTRLLLAPVIVQGAQAEESIVAGIRALDADARPELILVTRGGGSKEDLWVFNSERIARAAAACRKPVVSAVGHEVDYTILDYVADLRAPTPSAAAELCVPDKADALLALAQMRKKFADSIQSLYKVWYNHSSELAHAPALRSAPAAVTAGAERLARLQSGLSSAASDSIAAAKSRVQNAAALAAGLSPYNVLARGYAMVLGSDGMPRRTESLNAGDAILVQGAAAWAACKVEKTGKGRKGEY